MSGAYVFENAKVHESVPDSAGIDLTGKFLAEVPKNRGSFQVTSPIRSYFNLAVTPNSSGMQFDDDQNVLRFSGRCRTRRWGCPPTP